MTYDDIVRAEQKRAVKVIAKGAKRGGRCPQGSKPSEGNRLRAAKLEVIELKIEASGLEEYCSIL